MTNENSRGLGVLSSLLLADYSDPDPTPSMEAMVDGKVNSEIEFQIYGFMVDQTELDLAAGVEHQEQWSVKIAKVEKNFVGGVERVRSINQGEQYIRTLKIKSPSGGEKEIENESSRAEFEFMAMVSEQGMLKKRFTFPVGNDLVYEVDVFLAPDGSYHPCVKIDLEVKLPAAMENGYSKQELLEYISSIELPPVPITLKDIVVLPPVGRKPEDEKKVSEFYRAYFLTPNIFLSPDEPNASQISVQDVLRAFGG